VVWERVSRGRWGGGVKVKRWRMLDCFVGELVLVGGGGVSGVVVVLVGGGDDSKECSMWRMVWWSWSLDVVDDGVVGFGSGSGWRGQGW
jgi:hypothetical protein